MNLSDVLYEAFEEVLGISKQEIDADPEFDLMENEILDSLSIISILSAVFKKTGKEYDIRQMSGTDFSTFDHFLKALERQR